MWFQAQKEEGSMRKKLTDLEALIMAIVWDAGGQVTVRYVYENIQRKRKLAYTTIMTVMGRLVEKGILSRDKTGRAYLYAPLVTKSSMLGTSLKSLADQYFSGKMPSLVSHLLEHDVSDEQLANIEKTVKKIRGERKKK